MNSFHCKRTPLELRLQPPELAFALGRIQILPSAADSATKKCNQLELKRDELKEINLLRRFDESFANDSFVK